MKKNYLALDLLVIDMANDIVTESDNRPFTEEENGNDDIY